MSATGKKPTTIRLSAEARLLLDELASRFAVSQTAVIERAIREEAKREGLWGQFAPNRVVSEPVKVIREEAPQRSSFPQVRVKQRNPDGTISPIEKRK